MKLANIIKRDEVIYSGKNFFRLQADYAIQENKRTTQTEEQLAEEIKPPEEDKKSEGLPPADEAITTAGEPVELAEVHSEEQKKELKEPQSEPVAEVTDLAPPEVIIVSPALSSETTFENVPDEISSLRITGVVLDNSGIRELFVNDTEAEVGKQGKFTADIDLFTGINQITITASDFHENAATVSYSIERHQPVEQTATTVTRDSDYPVITLNAPEMDPEAKLVLVANTEKKVLVSGKVSDLTGVYEVLINGRDAVLSANGDFNGEVLLRVGENMITVKATDLELNSSADTFVVIRRDAMVQFGQPDITGTNDTYYALIIGVSQYPDPYLPDLNGHPTNDATRLSELLTARYLFDEENVTLLLNPKRVDILRSFDRLSKTITKDDNLLIFFAGHGFYNEDADLGYWLPSDAESDFTANYIYNNVLVDNLKRIPSKHTLLISDACFSGSIFKTRSMSFAAGAYQKKYNQRSRKAITSGAMDAVPNSSVFFSTWQKPLK